ncbi:MAG: hypothetical protein M3498_14620 [Deinococcota bacterium]|nr:hypothetical protein [Deinococcota bacterium]
MATPFWLQRKAARAAESADETLEDETSGWEAAVTCATALSESAPK